MYTHSCTHTHTNIQLHISIYNKICVNECVFDVHMYNYT